MRIIYIFVAVVFFNIPLAIGQDKYPAKAVELILP